MDSESKGSEMEAEKKKQVKAKLYNLKSQIDGFVGLVENGILDEPQICDALQLTVSKIVNEIQPADVHP